MVTLEQLQRFRPQVQESIDLKTIKKESKRFANVM